MKTLITGGFGYLGGRLAQFLASQSDYELFLGSRQQSEPPSWLPKSKVVCTEWASSKSLEKICAGIDTIVHLAGMNAQGCTADPIAALEFNAVATARLLRAAVRQRVRRFIYLSTAHVYSSPLTGKITEETHPTSLHPYATSHLAGEDVVRTAHYGGEIEGVVIRLSNAYGAPAHKDANCWMLLVNDLCRQAVTRRSMVLRSTGLQKRNFIPMVDACRAVEHLLHLPIQISGKNIFNVGGGESLAIWEAVRLVQERCTVVLGYHPKIECAPRQSDEISAELDYRSDALFQSGFRLGSNKVGEIDQLLKFCEVFQ